MRHAVTSKATTLVMLATLAFSPAALADRPQRQAAHRVEALASELKEAAADLTASAQKHRHRYTRLEAEALRRLEAFEASARRYYRRVGRNRGGLRKTWGSFQRVVRNYDRAVVALDRLHPVRHVRRNLNRADRLIDRLHRFYNRPHDGRQARPRPGNGPIRGH